MNSDVASMRLSIGLFYGKAYGIVIRSYTGKIPFSFIYLMQFFQRLKKSFWLLSSIIYNSINNTETAILVWLLIILSGDVETILVKIVIASIVCPFSIAIFEVFEIK